MNAVNNGDGSQHIEVSGFTFKDVENRNWATSFRGRIYIHASKKRIKYDEALINYLQERGVSAWWSLMLQGTKAAPVGVIIGEVDIVGCVKDSKSIWAEKGNNHFILANPEIYKKPIPYKGRLGFFEVQL